MPKFVMACKFSTFFRPDKIFRPFHQKYFHPAMLCRFNWQVQNYERFLKNTSFGVKNPSFFLGLRFSFLAMFDILC